MNHATDKKRWDDLHAAYARAHEAELAYEIELSAKYGHNFQRQWLSKGQRDKLESLQARKDKIGEKIFELITRVSPRDWSSGVPSWWVQSKLTWEDAIRPANEPLSVVVPGSYGYPDGYVKEEPLMTIRKYNDYEVDVLDANGRTYTYTIRNVETTSHAVKKALKKHGPTATWAGNVRPYQSLKEIPMSKREGQKILEDAEAAGEKFVHDQVGGDYFRDWVRDQLYEASRMDPSTVLPLETKSDARTIARNMLQQLEWDTKRDLDTREILRLSGAAGVFDIGSEDWVRDKYGIKSGNVVDEFMGGFQRVLHDPKLRDHLAEEILEMNQDLRGETSYMGEARHGAKPWFGSEGWWVYGIKIDGIENDFPLKPLGRQEEWPAVETFKTVARTDWIRAKHATSGTAALKRWVKAVNPSQFYAKWNEGDDSFKVWYTPSDGELRGGEGAFGVEESGGSNGAADFDALLRQYADVGDRQLYVRHEHRLGGPTHYYESVYVNFVNLPSGVGGAGGGAEAENNRMSFWIYGFNGSDPHAPPPSGKVKIEMANSALPREYRIRGKTGTPEAIAKYLGEFLTRVVREVPPMFTHTSRGVSETARRPEPAGDFRVKLLEGGWQQVPSLDAASAAISEERDRLGAGVSAWKQDTGQVVDRQGQLVARISYNGRIWPEPGARVVDEGAGKRRLEKFHPDEPGRTGLYRYGPATIWINGPVGGTWWATVKFRNQEKDLDARSFNDIMALATQWIDQAPELARVDEARGRAREHEVRADDSYVVVIYDADGKIHDSLPGFRDPIDAEAYAARKRDTIARNGWNMTVAVLDAATARHDRQSRQGRRSH